MALFGRKKLTVGLDVGSGLVKAVVIDHSGATPELAKVVITPLNDTVIVEGEVMDHSVVADAIRQTIAATGVKAKHLVAAVGGRDVIVKKITMERVKEAQARELMRWEAEQHVPFDMDSVELDFQVLDPDGDGIDMSVLLVAAKRELVENRQGLLQEAGAAATVIDVDAFALHNAFEANYPDAMNGTVALLNIGNEATNLNILDDGVPVLTRDLGIGTRRFREDMQREHGIGAEEAEDLLRGFDRHPMLESAIASRGEELAIGLERAATFLSSSSRSFGQIRAVYACGGGSRVPGLLPWISERLRIPVQPANALAQLAVRDGALEFLSTDEVGPLLMLPVGLALRSAA
ncbi:MAG: type IV pilus assembly protein PilM [Gemmatimonas sp.]|jgi:type IV pilus assembly protein PilM|uniref:type IV pilus assembly protein PilM n=2 Tax=Gemmatimonas sp. TaxID=1962908 RepID=UPI00391F429B|nr:pilus assembly protein PilM [Gemmatimonadota bacterium]